MSGEWPSTNARLVAISCPRPGRPRWTVMSLWESASFLGSCTELSATYASLPEAHEVCLGSSSESSADSRREALIAGRPRQDLTHVKDSRMSHGHSKHGFRPTGDSWSKSANARVRG